MPIPDLPLDFGGVLIDVATFLRPAGAKRAAFDVQTFPKARALGLRMSAPLVLAVGVGEGVGV